MRMEQQQYRNMSTARGERERERIIDKIKF
jgi:hypothetical protein